MYNLYTKHKNMIFKITCDNKYLLFLDIVTKRGNDNPNNMCLDVAKEIKNYFTTKNYIFKTPIKLVGTKFQKEVWKELMNIPFGKTASYEEIAIKLGNKNKVRAVANAAGKNNIILIVPCHRLIGKNGQLTGFRSGIKNKEILLTHEKNNIVNS